ncbi:MAG: AMP-binding protein [Xanthomonadales bacterium]|nr:AMP-binding protein [Xanthomonadales bacterium]
MGRPWPGADIKILDEDGSELPPGERGSVYIKLGDDGFSYHDDEAKTASNRRGEYFTVGDIGELDEAGYLYLRDRTADLIIAGGVNIYPVEIEHALLLHPAVADVGVIGIPDDDMGERILAVVELTADQHPGEPLEEMLRTHCEAHLARFKLPKQFEFVTSLPRDPSGKLFKRRLRDQYAPAATSAG